MARGIEEIINVIDTLKLVVALLKSTNLTTGLQGIHEWNKMYMHRYICSV